MSIRVTRDPDNKWYVYLDWNPWINEQANTSPNGPNMTITITAVSWSIPVASGITEEAETPSDDDAGYTYLFATGGTAGTQYDITCTITYTATSASTSTTKTDLTQSQTFTVLLRDQ